MSEEGRRTFRYVEPLNDARTPPGDFFGILLVERELLGEVGQVAAAVLGHQYHILDSNRA